MFWHCICWCLSLWLLFLNVNFFAPFWKSLSILMCLVVTVLLEILASVLINIDDLNTSHNRTKLLCFFDEAKLTYIDNMWTFCISLWLADYQIESLVMNIAHWQKYGVLFDIGVNALCDDLTMNYLWWYLEFSPLVRLTKWCNLFEWS